jgi:hypothetical protein
MATEPAPIRPVADVHAQALVALGTLLRAVESEREQIRTAWTQLEDEREDLERQQEWCFQERQRLQELHEATAAWRGQRLWRLATGANEVPLFTVALTDGNAWVLE